MNLTLNDSLVNQSGCFLEARIHTPFYLFAKLVSATYLRAFIGPGILLNTLCLIVLSRPRLAQKSTTILFLLVLALFDILSITFKYLRAELNYQSVEVAKSWVWFAPNLCKILYVLANASVSIAMWTIVLMSM